MKKILLTCHIIPVIILVLTNNCFAQSVAINTDGSTADASAILDIKSTSKGLLLPRMTTAQRTAIGSPALGLKVFDTDTKTFWFYNGSTWIQSATGSTNFWNSSSNNIFNTNTNNVGIGISSPTAKLHIKGSQDTSQLVIDAYSVQTTPLIRLRDASGQDLLHIRADNIYNVFFGFNAGASNDLSTGFGLYNTFIGSNSGVFNTIGEYNTSLGRASFYQNTTGKYNVALGFHSLFSNIDGFANTAAGSDALKYNISGSYNAANGAAALYSNVNGFYNTASGSNALNSNTTGSSNTADGYEALWQNVSGSNNIALGRSSGVAPPGNFNNTISIGNFNYMNAASNQAFFGNLSIIWNGGNATWSTFSDARMKNNIRQDVKGLEFIMKLRPVTYFTSIKAIMTITGNKNDVPDYPGKYEADKIRQSGFLAQEVEQAAKESGYEFSGVTHVPQNEKELYTLSYEQFVVPLVKAVQELNIKVKQLEKENELLKANTQQVDPVIMAKQQHLIEQQQQKIDLLEKRLSALEEAIRKQ